MESTDTSIPGNDDLQQHTSDSDTLKSQFAESDRPASSHAHIETSAPKQPVEQGSTAYNVDIQQLLEAKKRELLQKLDNQKQDLEVATSETAQAASRTLPENSSQHKIEGTTSGASPEFEQLTSTPLISGDTEVGAKRTRELDQSDSEGEAKKLRPDTKSAVVQQNVPTDQKRSSGMARDSQKVDDSSGCWENIVLASSVGSDFTGAWTEFAATPDNFLKGCKWSPDGSCIVTNSNDNCLRVFKLPPEIWPTGGKYYKKLPELKSAVQIQEGELIYDYAWYPHMTASDPDTCCLVSSCRDTPVHMWDSQTGKLRCSYRAFDHMDELTAAHSLAFSTDGTKLYSGFTKMIRVFDVARPGKDCQQRPTFVKQGQTGIISCIAMNPADSTMYAAGSYSRSVALYMEPKGEMYCMFEGQTGGITHLAFSKDGNRLYSGGRKDSEILCWDLRQPGKILGIMNRKVDTNQRIYFDLADQFLWSGGTDGTVTAWDVTDLDDNAEEQEEDPLLAPQLQFTASWDAVNGVGYHPQLPILAVSTGQRQFPLPSGLDESSDSESEQTTTRENCLKLYWKDLAKRMEETD